MTKFVPSPLVTFFHSRNLWAMSLENLWFASIRVLVRPPSLFVSPLNDELEPVAAAFDELLGLVVGQVEHVDAVDLDEVVVGPAASLARDAVQGDLGTQG